MSWGLRRVAVSTMLCALVLTGSFVPVASASPAAEAAALASLKKDWAKYQTGQKLGTCNAYRTAGTRMAQTAASGKWEQPKSHRSMTLKGWQRTYARYFAWACSGPNKGPRV
jgi:hypothetical protein